MSLSSSASRLSISSLGSDDLHNMSFFVLENDPLLLPTPPPTTDEDSSADEEFVVMPVSPVWERPETSTSSIFSYVADRARESSLPATALTLPTFIVPENPGFYDSDTSSDIIPINTFHRWMELSKPDHDSFDEEFAVEQARNPRQVRSVPAIPSLFKKREYECGYCKSVGHSGWQTHSRQRCLKLRSLPPCKICGANGEMNHTETYCPNKPSVRLPLTERFLSELNARSSDRRQYFDKYSDLIQRIYPSGNVSSWR